MIEYLEAEPINWFLKIWIADEVLLLADDILDAVWSLEENSPKKS